MMDPLVLQSFKNELCKSAGLGDLWQGFLDIFRGERSKAQRRVDYHFSPKAGTEKWLKFGKNIGSKEFVNQLAKHPDADDKLVLHARSMHSLAKGDVAGKVESEGGKGKTYEIRKLPGGNLGCTCNDWKFKGSINPGYECKHIRAYKEGKTKVANSIPAFFDELSRITELKLRDREKYTDKRTGRPFTSDLTQDEEPTDYNPMPNELEEPELIIAPR